MFLWPIVSDNADKLHIGKKARRIGKMRGRTAEQAVTTGLRRFDVINGHGTDNKERHSLQLSEGRKNGKKEGGIIDRAVRLCKTEPIFRVNSPSPPSGLLGRFASRSYAKGLARPQGRS